jgi:putative addiction module component (TIGR02574 family)
MGEKVSELLKQALALPAEARAALANSLLESLDEDVLDEGAEQEWEREIQRRLKELDSGAVQTIPWSEVRRRMLARIADAEG